MTNTTTPQTVRVLLVEDSTLVRARVRGLLEEAGVTGALAEAGTAAAARAAFAASRPAAVVLDLNLPDGDGLELLAGFKRARPECVVIILSNFATPESRARCRQLGADHFFEKSREFERVPEVLTALAAGGKTLSQTRNP